MPRFVVAVAAVLTALALAGAALAAVGPRPQGYQGPGESVQGQVGNQGGVAGEETGFGALPFSGQDLTLLAAGGAALILVGGGFYRLSRRRQ